MKRTGRKAVREQSIRNAVRTVYVDGLAGKGVFAAFLMPEWVAGLILATLIPFAASIGAAAAPAGTNEFECRRAILSGEVNAGQEWSAPIGEGWVFRLIPIASPASTKEPYSGWDLAIDRTSGAGYPDALLLATPPYGSLNEREIGTTYGMRAQDAIAWDKRRFHFLTTPEQLKRGQAAYRTLMAAQNGLQPLPEKPGSPAAEAQTRAASELLSLASNAASGQFQVLDARLSPGSADPPSFARLWAEHLYQVPHTIVPAAQNEAQAGGQSAAQSTTQSTPGNVSSDSPRGELKWIRFSLILWFPHAWNTPTALQATTAKCAQ